MIINLQLKTKKEAVTTYLSLLYRFHKLSDRELDLAVELIMAYFNAIDVYESTKAADKLYLDTDNREAIMKSLELTPQVFRNYLTTFKKKGVLKEDGTLNKVLVPDIENNKFNLTINLSFDVQERLTSEVHKEGS